jgi:hypothetical protein
MYKKLDKETKPLSRLGKSCPPPLVTQGMAQGEDYYMDAKTGFMVFTAKYLLKRGYCCSSGCRHCPYAKPGI